MTNKIQDHIDSNEITNKKPRNQIELAKIVGIKREYINRIINRKITPSVTLGMRIARALKTPVEELFFLDSND